MQYFAFTYCVNITLGGRILTCEFFCFSCAVPDLFRKIIHLHIRLCCSLLVHVNVFFTCFLPVMVPSLLICLETAGKRGGRLLEGYSI